MPELKKASGHSNPEVRDKALVALGVIQRGQQRNAPDSPGGNSPLLSPSRGPAAGAGMEELKLSEGKDDYILDLRGFILAFSGRVLLKKAALSIRGGHCYGIVGQNGAGKTTLLTRIAAGDIDGFPSALNVYYVQHEIVEEDSTSVTVFMSRQVCPGVLSLLSLRHGARFASCTLDTGC